MIDDILQRRPKKHTRDLNIVPILDMLTTVIFFLLMSTTFIEYTKLTLPPAKTVTSTTPSASNPITPKLIVVPKGENFTLKLTWQGKQPGEDAVLSSEANVVPKLMDVLKKFSAKYPSEKTLQVSLEKDVPYQVLISVMDSARDVIPDVVLLSYHEAGHT